MGVTNVELVEGLLASIAATAANLANAVHSSGPSEPIWCGDSRLI